jgi:hypothetical protein
MRQHVDAPFEFGKTKFAPPLMDQPHKDQAEARAAAPQQRSTFID